LKLEENKRREEDPDVELSQFEEDDLMLEVIGGQKR